MRHDTTGILLTMTWLLTTPMQLTAGEDTPSRSRASNTRYLIIHADDAGMSHSANLATIDAMEKGAVSSASIMVPCPWFPEIARYAQEHPQRDFGVHLTLTCEWKDYRWGPVADRKQVTSLVDSQGYLWRSTPEVARHARAAEVELELRAQIERAKKFGVPITHLDTHMGAVVSRPDLLRIYVQLGIEYDVPVLFLKQINRQLSAEYPALADTGVKLLQQLEQHQLPVLDHLVQHYGDQAGVSRRDGYLQALRKLPAGVSQLIIHCGYDNQELRAITNSSSRRDEDRQIFSDPRTTQFLHDQKIQLIGWRQFRALQ